MELLSFVYSVALVCVCGLFSNCISLKLPHNLSQDMVCSGCEGLITELHKRLMKKSSDFLEVRVIDAMDGICSNEHFKVYDYIPPKMVRACKYIIDQFDEDLENNLISYFRPPIGQLDMLIIKVCHNLTKYCEGHDKEAERNKKDQTFKMMVDGEEKEFPIKYGSGEDDEATDETTKPDDNKDYTKDEDKSEKAEPESKPDKRSEPADEDSELRVEEEHDEL